MKRTVLNLALFGAILAAGRSSGIDFGAFGPHGEGGTKNGQTFQIGSGGIVYEIDSFLSISGLDLNGAQAGTAAQLSTHSLPAGLVLTFSSGISNSTDAVLTYLLANQTNVTFTNLTFNVLLDAEIDQTTNTFFNEYGRVIGTRGVGSGDPAPDMWQIDEPGFESGTLFNNLFLGSLNNSNSIPQSAPNDVAFGLGFFLGNLAPGQSSAVSVMISEAGHKLGTFALQQLDTDTNSATVVTFSAVVATLAGTIFKDVNTNGVFDTGEGLAGVRVLLLNNGGTTVAQAITDSGGSYSFTTPPPGTYTVKVDPTTLPGGLTNTVDPDGTKDGQTVTTLAPGQLTILNWGYQAPPGTQQLEDVTVLTQLSFQWRLKPSTGSLIGTLTITNLPTSTATLSSPFYLGFPTSTNYWYAHPAGNLPNGLPYVNITAEVVAQAGADGVLSPGEKVIVDGIEIFSRNRNAPPTSLFKLWATH